MSNPYGLMWGVGLGPICLFIATALKRHASIRIILHNAEIQIETGSNLRHPIIAYFFLMKLKEKLFYASILILCAIAYTFLLFLNDGNIKYTVMAISFFLSALLILDIAFLKYRINKCTFGANSFEANEFIHLLIDKSEDIDFSDTDGLMKTLFEDAPRADYDSVRVPQAE